jgi:hypothetical protein
MGCRRLACRKISRPAGRMKALTALGVPRQTDGFQVGVIDCSFAPDPA